VRDADLPEPEVNASLAALDHQPHEVDLSWPAHHLIIETDGYDTHGTRQAFEQDRKKDAALTATGYRVVRFTWRAVLHDPATVADRLTALLRP
jgi:very-short-patch-repair endonuclease